MEGRLPDGSIPSPQEFLPDKMKMNGINAQLTSLGDDVLNEMNNILLPAVSPLLNRMAELAKRYGIDMTFKALNGMEYAFRSSDYVPGEKARLADLVHGIVSTMENYTIEDFKRAILSLHEQIHKA